MSRIRTVKPEFWTSEQVVSCSPPARLLFIGLWNFCDDHGVHPASYVRLKAEIFPTDSFTIENIKCWLGELIQNDLVREYAVDNKPYWIVTGWSSHQRIDKPTYRHPLPLSDLKKISDGSWNVPRALDEISMTSNQINNDISATDRNGREWNGKEKDIGEVKASPVSDSNSNSLNYAQEVFAHWQHVMNHPRARLDRRRENKIAQALKLEYTVEELKQAVDGCAKTPYNMGKNDSGQTFDDIGLILRDAEHIERFMNNATNPPEGKQSDVMKEDIMAGVL